MSLGSAVFSPCGKYRYRLERVLIDPADDIVIKSVAFCMLNPSTADAMKDDNTIRRCKAYAKTWGYNRLIVVNLFAWRATMPMELYRHDVDPVGADNDEHILRAAREADKLVCAWGQHGALLSRASIVLNMLCTAGLTRYGLAFTKDGHPKHPLYLRGDALPQVFN